jgi:C-terminal processing protease CtpA/Prc
MGLHNRIIPSLLLVFAVSACGFVGENQKTPGGYVRHCVRMLDREALYADRPEWREAKAAVLAEAKTFTTMDQAHEAVSRAAQAAGGKHSALVPPVTDTTSYPEAAPEVKSLEGNILHIVLPSHSGVKVPDSLYVHRVLDFLHGHLDAKGIILDLRGNTGGNMGPMIASVSPLLPDGIILRFQGRTRTTPIYLESVLRGAGLSSESIKKLPASTPVALLTDEGTGSSGEVTLLCFRGLDNVRTFGSPTSGYASANVTKFLSDGYLLLITTASDMARTGEIFCDDPIEPDVRTGTPLEDAVIWVEAMSQE